MKNTLWKALGALGIAAAVVCVAPTALSSSKKTPTPSADASAASTSSSGKSAKVEKVNLNTADEKDVAAAKGVGAKLAKELVAGRPYKTWDDVSKVKGVGTGKKLDSLKKVLKLSEGVGTTAAKDEPAAKETKGKKSKSSSKGEEGGATGNASTPSSPSSPSKKSSSSSSSSSSSEKAAAPKLAPGEKININTASAEELDKLPEIGPVKAQAIVDYRSANGKFAAIEDVMKVSGIKEGTFAKIKDFIVVR
jgi:competence protein ComEA